MTISDSRSKKSSAYRFFTAYWRIGRALRDHLDPLLEREHGLTLRDYLLLNTIHWGAHYPSELSETLRMSKDLTSRIIANLLELGLITRSIDSQDSRRTRLELTELGETKRSKIKTQLEGAVEGLMVALTPTEGERLLGSLETFSDLIVAAVGDPDVHNR